MMSLFSSFDSKIFSYFSIFLCVYMFLMFPLIKLNFYKLMINKYITLMNYKNDKFTLILMMSTGLMIWMMNLSSLFLYHFTYTSMISLNLTLALIFWMSFMSFKSTYNKKEFMSHLIPEGCPMLLVLFLFLIEFVSNMIRPLTLTLRLLANMVAGHLMMNLIFFFLEVKWTLLMNLFMTMVEIMVGTIQSYIFFTLTMMYYEEIFPF